MLTSGMSSRARDTFVAQQQIKTYVQSARIIRRKSMLITRNSNDKEWVHGIGIRFEKSGTQWRMTQFKALRVVQGNQFFYLSYPKTNPCLEVEWLIEEGQRETCSNDVTEMKLKRLEGTVSQYMPETMALGVEIRNDVNSSVLTCTKALTVIYESINGEMHVYCQSATSSEVAITGNLNLLVKVNYLSAGGTYRFKLNLKSNGEINAVTNP